jgi:hypothetical protein
VRLLRLYGGTFPHTDCRKAAAERREMYQFSVDLGKLGLQIAENFGTSEEKW